MAWTYTPTLLSTTPLFQVRLLIGDTLASDPLLLDEEITFLLVSQANAVLPSASQAAESIAGKFARLASQSVGRVSVSLNQKYEHYLELASKLRDRALDPLDPLASGAAFPIPSFGGASKADKEILWLDPDAVKPDHYKNEFDNPPRRGDLDPRTGRPW